ncbi:MAG: hypothetical protein P4L65_06310 [Legionella sp.]|nr:hypothetical protein [Legionella sp.]
MPTTNEIQNYYNGRIEIIDKWRDAQLSQMRESNNPNLSEGLIRSLHEQLLVQEKFFADMGHMKNMLSVMLTEISLSKTQKNLVIDYMAKLDKVIATHKAFNNGPNDIIAAIDKKNISTEELAKAIQTLYATNELQEFVSALATISPENPELDALAKQKKSELGKNKQYLEAGTSTYSSPNATQTRGIPVFSIMPTQFIPKMTMTLKEVKGQAESIIKKQTNVAEKNSLFNEVLVTSVRDTMEDTIRNAGIGARVNLQIGARIATKNAEALFAEDLKPEEKKVIALRKILSINMNTPLAVKGDSEVKDFDSYLQTVLLNAYPNLFKLDPHKNEFSISAGDKYTEIHKALGIDMRGKDKITLDPVKFDAQSLDMLYKSDENPLWIALKSTKPVDAQFTAVEKIKSYEEIALEFQNKKIGDTQKSEGAYQVAKAAKAIATEYGEVEAFKSAFAPDKKDGLGEWMVSKGKKQADKDEITRGLTLSKPASKTELSQSSESFAPSFDSSSSSSSSSLSDAPELSVVSVPDEQPWTPDIRPQVQEALASEVQLNELEQIKLQLHTIQQELIVTKEELASSQQEVETVTSRMQQAELQIAEAPRIIQQELNQTKKELDSSQQELESEKKAHSVYMQQAELQLAKAQQTIQEQSTSLTQEQDKSQQLGTELGRAKVEISAHIEEEEKLTSKVTTLQEKLITERQNTQNAEAAATELTNSKILLAVSVGSMGHILNQDDNRNLPKKIMDIKSTDDLKSMTQQVESLNKINRAVNGIINSLEKRDGFFNSAPVKKINAIKEAFKTLSLEQKIELSQLDDSTIKDKLNDKDPIAAFLKAVNQNRALIGISSEATSFKDFKKELAGLKPKSDEAPKIQNANGPGVS